MESSQFPVDAHIKEFLEEPLVTNFSFEGAHSVYEECKVKLRAGIATSRF